MNASRTARRTLVSAGAGAIIAAGALAAGIATQPYPALAEDATYDTVASDVSYSDVTPGDSDAAADGSTPADDTQQGDQSTAADAGTQNAPTFSAASGAPAATASKPCLALSVPGSFDTAQAEALLARINEIRAEAAAEGLVDYESGTAVTGAPLTWSTGLEQMAQVRAVEASYSFSHTRPDGSGTVLDANGPLVAGANPTVLAENLAQASDTASALELWYAEKDAYERYLAATRVSRKVTSATIRRLSATITLSSDLARSLPPTGAPTWPASSPTLLATPLPYSPTARASLRLTPRPQVLRQASPRLKIGTAPSPLGRRSSWALTSRAPKAAPTPRRRSLPGRAATSRSSRSTATASRAPWAVARQPSA